MCIWYTYIRRQTEYSLTQNQNHEIRIGITTSYKMLSIDNKQKFVFRYNRNEEEVLSIGITSKTEDSLTTTTNDRMKQKRQSIYWFCCHVCVHYNLSLNFILSKSNTKEFLY